MSHTPLRSVAIDQGVIVNVLLEKANRVVGRTEVMGEIIHLGRGTPNRGFLRETLAKLYGRTPDHVVVRYVKGEYGSHRSTFRANVYDSIDRLKFFEPEYLVKRG
ncbi:MAG: 30S ribosomal protein S24e [Zestosphaera sp.]